MIRLFFELSGVAFWAGVGLGVYELRKHGVTFAMVKAALADLKKGG